MSEMNWKTGILLVIFCVGVLLEVFKNTSSPIVHKMLDKSTFSMMNAFVKPYSVKQEATAANIPDITKSHPIDTRKFDPALEGKLKQFVDANTQQETDFDPKDKGGEGHSKGKKRKKTAKNDEDEYEYFTDPETGKKYRRKKKKVAKTEEKTEQQEATPEEPKTEADQNANVYADQVMTAQNVQQEPKEESPNLTLEDWIRRLLTQPDPEATKDFIKQFKASKVSGSVFYKIAKMMVDDPRPEMKKLGITCAAASPSATSFTILTSVEKTEKHGTSLYSQADSALNNYASLNHLSVLQKMLRHSDTFNVVVATQKVELAANRYLVVKPPKRQPSDTQPTPTDDTEKPPVKIANAASFQPFVPLLETLTKSKNTTVASQAQSTLANLRRMLGTNITPPNPDQPGTPLPPSDIGPDLNMPSTAFMNSIDPS